MKDEFQPSVEAHKQLEGQEERWVQLSAGRRLCVLSSSAKRMYINVNKMHITCILAFKQFVNMHLRLCFCKSYTL